MLQVGCVLAKHDYELRCSVINAIQEKRKNTFVGRTRGRRMVFLLRKRATPAVDTDLHSAFSNGTQI